MLFRSRAWYIWGIFSVLLVIMLAVGCTFSSVDGDQTPEPPSSLTIVDNDGDDQDSAEDQSDASETVDSFIKTTQLIQAEDGSAIVQVVTESPLDQGTYQAHYFDSEGGELTAPCLRIEGVDSELQCSMALAGGLQLVEFQLYYLEPFDLFFSAGVDFTGTALVSLFDNVDAYLLPPEFQPDYFLSEVDTSLFVHHICSEWSSNSYVPDTLNSFCKAYGYSVENPNYFGEHLDGPNNPWASSTMPDPDCDGVDAGSFWCQETEEEEYLAGRLATTCLEQINTAFEDPLTAFEDPLTAFEDPLTAFEDPLTAFEDPLTAFEDPLTAFEDPLTAFEDPLTAVDVARTTILYRIAAPFIPNPAPLDACNRLAMLGDHSQYLRNGETLIEYMSGVFPSFKPISDRIPLDTSELTVMLAHCGYFDDMNFESRYVVELQNHQVIAFFDPMEPLPGLNYFVFGDPTPYHYSATLGGSQLNSCYFGGDTGLRCDWNNLDESVFGQDQEYALYVTGCEEPLHTGIVTLPAYDYSRCTVFEEMEMSLGVADPSPNLSIYVTMPNGVPGLEVENYPGFDNLEVNYFSRFCGEQAFCEVYDWLPGKLYCNISVSPDCLTNLNEFNLLVDNCGLILARDLLIVAPPSVSDNGGNSESGGGGGSLCTGSEPNTWVCGAHGGSWSGSSATVGTCTCP